MASVDMPMDMANLRMTLVEGKSTTVCHVLVSGSGISWETLGNADSKEEPTAKNHITTNTILIAVATESLKHAQEADNWMTTIHYALPIIQKNEVITKAMTLTFVAAKDICVECAEKVNELIKTETHRPKRILLFLNPNSGTHKALSLYKTKVAPLLNLVGVQVDLIHIGSDSKDTEDVLDKYDLSTIDAVAVMGGDGTLGTVCLSLLKRTQKDAGIDMNEPDAELVTPALPLVVIPAGTGNGQAVMFHFTKDVQSSVICLILGHTRPKDITTFYTDGKFQGLSMIILGFGLLGTVRQYVESHRWMGGLRYLLALVSFMKRRVPYEIDLDFLPMQTEPETPATWQTYQGSVNAVNVFPVIYPTCETSPASLKLTWIHPCSKRNIWKYLMRVIKSEDMDGLDFVGHSDVTRFRVRTPENNLRTRLLEWDGEVLELPAPNLDVRLHRGLVNLIGLDPIHVPADVKAKWSKTKACS